MISALLGAEIIHDRGDERSAARARTRTRGLGRARGLSGVPGLARSSGERANAAAARPAPGRAAHVAVAASEVRPVAVLPYRVADDEAHGADGAPADDRAHEEPDEQHQQPATAEAPRSGAPTAPRPRLGRTRRRRRHRTRGRHGTSRRHRTGRRRSRRRGLPRGLRGRRGGGRGGRRRGRWPPTGRAGLGRQIAGLVRFAHCLLLALADRRAADPRPACGGNLGVTSTPAVSSYRTVEPYICPNGSAMSSSRAPSGSRK